MEFFGNPIIILCFCFIALILGIILLSFILGLIIFLTIYFMKIFGVKFNNIDYKE